MSVSAPSESCLTKTKQLIRELKEVLEELDGLINGLIIRLAAILFLLFAVAKLFATH